MGLSVRGTQTAIGKKLVTVQCEVKSWDADGRMAACLYTLVHTMTSRALLHV